MNKIYKQYILFLFILTASSTILHSQAYRKSFWSYGLFGDFLLAKHITQFSALPGIPNCCPEFTDGNGSGFAAGLLLQYRFYAYNNILLRVGYKTISGNFEAQEPEWVIIDNKLTPAIIQHNITTNFSMPFIEPTYKYNTMSGFSVSIGINLSYLSSATFSQEEVLIKPADQGTFETGTRTRNVHSGNLQETNSFLTSALFATEYEIVLEKHKLYILTPRFSFNYGLNSIFKNEKWRITYFSFGISLKYNPYYNLSNPLKPY